MLIRYGFTSKQIMVCLVINGDGLDSKRRVENVNVSCVASGKITDKRDRDRASYNKANDSKVRDNKANDSKVSCNKANDSKASDNKPCDSKASDSRYNATDTLCERLSKIDGMTSISYNINKENTNVILGKKTVCIWGRSYIEDTIHLLSYPDFTPQGTGITYQISPQSFYQVNPKQTEKLYSTALEFAGLTGKESVWDLYCGIGTSATRAEILKKLCNIKYLALNKKTQVITPTLLGEMIFDVVNCSIRQLLNPELTASWEKGLNYVAEGSITEQEYMDKLEGFVFNI